MSKVSISPAVLIPVRSPLLVGANVAGKPNFSTYGAGGHLSSSPPIMAVPFMHQRHTLKGVRENNNFSVNVPSTKQAAETDYCGVISGRDADKVRDCKFEVFYGELKTAPMISRCPVNFECRVLHLLDLGSHVVAIAEVVKTYVSEECLTEGKPDVGKISPLLVGMFGVSSRYYALGDEVAQRGIASRKIKGD
jgi:flavin reductase (DIM6/NTAB) family NADH-FMN oxidoreductase RutF